MKSEPRNFRDHDLYHCSLALTDDGPRQIGHRLGHPLNLPFPRPDCLLEDAKTCISLLLKHWGAKSWTICSFSANTRKCF